MIVELKLLRNVYELSILYFTNRFFYHCISEEVNYLPSTFEEPQ